MFKCPYCAQQFSFESSKQIHVNRHHQGTASASTPASTSSLMADDDSTGFVSSFLSSEATQPSLDFSSDVVSVPDPGPAPDFGGFDGSSSDGGGASSNW